jgi:hypothetical protein
MESLCCASCSGALCILAHFLQHTEPQSPLEVLPVSAFTTFLKYFSNFDFTIVLTTYDNWHEVKFSYSGWPLQLVVAQSLLPACA